MSTASTAGGRRPAAAGHSKKLQAEAYRYVFVERFAALKAQTLAKSDVDGVVLVSVRHFLHDRQRQHDRLGARLFEVLSLAVRRAVECGDLTVSRAPTRSSDSTVLAVGERASSADLARPEMLAPIVRRWNDELLPDLVTASRADKRRLVEGLAVRCGELDLTGIRHGLRFGMLAPLRGDVRRAMGDAARARRRGACRRRERARLPPPALQLRADLRSPDDRGGPLRQAHRLCRRPSRGVGTPSGPRVIAPGLLLFLRAFATEGGETLEEETAAVRIAYPRFVVWPITLRSHGSDSVG